MRIRKKNLYKTVFHILYSYFKYKMIFFGLSNTLTSFHGYIDKILFEELDVIMIVHLDNILIYINYVDHVNAI